MALIALDIDGTITHDKYHVSEKILSYLSGLVKKGHTLLFSTGRTFSFANSSLKDMKEPFYFSLQNGSVLLKMPEKVVLDRVYMTPQDLPLVEKAYLGIKEDFLIYAGVERGDFCFYRRERFSKQMLPYIDDLMTRQREVWRSVPYFDPDSIQEFPLIKGVGSYEAMLVVKNRLETTKRFSLPINKDPFSQDYFLLQITHIQASKGHVIDRLLKRCGMMQPVVAAGDDENDLPMLQIADKKIVINTAPDSLKKIADYLAEPPAKFGIIDALEKALGEL